jgi:plastocyanin
MRISSIRASLALVVYTSWMLAVAGTCLAQDAAVTAQIEMTRAKEEKKGTARPSDLSNVVVWLTPTTGKLIATAGNGKPEPQLVQQSKSFQPHVLVIQAGSLVQFPNHDHFLHNVFSLHDGKRFDLGFYEAGSAKSIRFERPGISFLFCNIHPEMSAAVVAVDTPYFGISDRTGHLAIANIPDGKYILHVWAEQSLPEELAKLDREVTVSASERSLGVIRVSETANFSGGHKNKFGEDYVPPTPGSYGHP